MLRLWNFSSTLGRPNSEEKERKRRLREAQLQQIQRELTLDRKLIATSGPWNNPPSNSSNLRPQRAKTFRHPHAVATESDPTSHRGLSQVTPDNNLRFRSKSSHKLDEESQFVSRLRFLDSSPTLNTKRHSSAFLTPGDDDQRWGHDLYGMRRRYTTAFDSEDTEMTTSTVEGRGSDKGRGVTFAAPSSGQRLRFSDQAGDMSTTSGTYGTSDDGFNDSRSAIILIPSEASFVPIYMGYLARVFGHLS